VENDYDVVFKINIFGSAGKYTIKKVDGFPVPSRELLIYSLSCRESLVCDIPAGDGITANLFLQCMVVERREALLRPQPTPFYSYSRLLDVM
jgi:hypothetical protein